MKIIDRTKTAMGWQNPFQTRKRSDITHIAVHHSATPTGNTAAFENHWRNQGWRNGGYAYVILRDGQIEHNYPDTVVTNGVLGHNHYVLNVCVVGSGQFTYLQEEALIELLTTLMDRHNIPASNVLGHNEFSGNATQCPGRNMDFLRTRLGSGNAPTANGTHIVASGDTLWSIAQRYSTTVQALQQANNIQGNLIRVGQQLIIPRNVPRFFPPVTNLSIVDALKSINVDSSFAFRQRIAIANGIQNYASTAPQNIHLSNLLSRGLLLCP